MQYRSTVQDGNGHISSVQRGAGGFSMDLRYMAPDFEAKRFFSFLFLIHEVIGFFRLSPL
jgi:hypothetical protein